jgi:hypothetical protein
MFGSAVMRIDFKHIKIISTISKITFDHLELKPNTSNFFFCPQSELDRFIHLHNCSCCTQRDTSPEHYCLEDFRHKESEEGLGDHPQLTKSNHANEFDTTFLSKILKLRFINSPT